MEPYTERICVECERERERDPRGCEILHSTTSIAALNKNGRFSNLVHHACCRM